MICKICGAWSLTHPEKWHYVKCQSCGCTEKEKPVITLEMYTKGRDTTYPEEWTEEVKINSLKLLGRVNSFLDEVGYKNVTVSSGFRPLSINDATANAAKASNHTKGLAIDIQDLNGDLMNIILMNLDKCVKYELYMEDFRWCKSWCHIQCIPPKSKRRIYIPSLAPAPAPDRWSGDYDGKYNG